MSVIVLIGPPVLFKNLLARKMDMSSSKEVKDNFIGYNSYGIKVSTCLKIEIASNKYIDSFSQWYTLSQPKCVSP